MDNNKPQTTKDEEDRIFNDTEGEFRTRFELLPSELQQAITSSEFQTKLFEIAKKYKLTYDRLGKLEMETTMVLLGMTPPDEYRGEIERQIEIKGNDLDAVVHDVNEQVFKPIRESLMKLYKKEEVEEGEKLNTGNKEDGTGKMANDKYLEPTGEKTPETPAAVVDTKKPEVIALSPAPVAPKPKIPEQSPADKVAELKKSLSQAVQSTSQAPKPPLSASKMSISEIIEKAGDMKPKLSEGTPKSTPLELNSGTEKMVSNMDAGKPYGMQTMPKAVETIQKIEPTPSVTPIPQKDNGSLLGQIKSIFSEPKKPIDVIIKNKEDAGGSIKTPDITSKTPQAPTGDRYHEPIE